MIQRYYTPRLGPRGPAGEMPRGAGRRVAERRPAPRSMLMHPNICTGLSGDLKRSYGQSPY